MNASRGHAHIHSSVLDVPRGLFLLRYVGLQNSDPPTIHLSVLSGSEGRIHILCHPDASNDVLRFPGDVLAVSSLGARIQIGVEPSRAGASIDARVALDALVVHDNASPPDVASWRSLDDRSIKAASGERFSFALRAHVARRGDLSVDGGEWIAGPKAPSPVEGLQLDTNASASHWLEIQVLASDSSQWSPWRTAGQFLGSRGRALPLVGVRVRATNSAPAELYLTAAAVFLGSPVTEAEGRQIELRSTAGSDPIVGIRIDARLKTVVEPIRALGSDSSASQGRVRVFRAKDKQFQRRA